MQTEALSDWINFHNSVLGPTKFQLHEYFNVKHTVRAE